MVILMLLEYTQHPIFEQYGALNACRKYYIARIKIKYKGIVMKKIILIMGQLASLKSTIANRLGKELKLLTFCKDEVKEILGDHIGFNNREENLKLSKATFFLLSDIATKALDKEITVILESNFKYHELAILKSKIDLDDIKVLTVFLTGEADILYQRYLDRQDKRHPVHQSTGIMSFETFKDSMLAYHPDQLIGTPLMFDTSDFDETTYQNIKKCVIDFLMEN